MHLLQTFIMLIFETERLAVRTLTSDDYNYFAELLSDPAIVSLIPQPPYPKAAIDEKFQANLHLAPNIIDNKHCAWGIYEKGKTELIGLCLFLTNDEEDRELGYRFRVPYWRKGYGTEVTQGMLKFCFETLKLDKITADCDATNIGSKKILDRTLRFVRAFYNERDNCTDRRYALTREEWLDS